MADKPAAPAEKSKISASFLNEMGGRPADAPIVPVTEPLVEPKKVDAPKVAITPADDKGIQPVTPEPKPKAKRRAAGFEDVPEIMTGLKEVAKSMTDAAEKMVTAKATTPEPKSDEFKFTEEEQDQLSTLESMESLYPDRYKGIAEKARSYIKTVESHEAAILADRPNITDDEMAEEMEEFRHKSGVKWSETDFRKAEIQSAIRPLREEKERLERQVGQIVETEHQAKVQPKARDYATKVVRDDVVSELGKEFDGLIGDDGKIVKSFSEKLAADDPLIADVVLDAAERARSFTEACVLVFNGGNSDLVGQVVQWAKNAEATFSGLPKEEQINDNGQMFAPRAAWVKMDEATRAKHWIVGPDEIVPLATDGLVTFAKGQIARIRDRDSKKYPATATPKTIDKPVSPSSANPNPAAETVGVSSGFFADFKKPSVR